MAGRPRQWTPGAVAVGWRGGGRVAAEERFDETFVDAFVPEPMTMTYGAMVAHVLTFAAHHRLLAVSRLRGYGIDDLGVGDPKRWFNPPN